MNILLISPEHWSASGVSKHHYAMTLATTGHRVFFLGPPEAATVSLALASVESYPNLAIVRGPRVAPGLRFLPRFLRSWLEARWLAKLEVLVGCEIDAIWLFENSRFYDLRFAGNRLKIYHQVDLNQAFRPATAAATADICFCTTEFIRKSLLPHNQRVFKIHHGLAQSDSVPILSDEQRARFDHGGPQAVYIGNLDMAYLDADLLAETVRQFPAVRFHLVGAYSRSGELWQKANESPNVVWWGKVASDMIPSILESADVLLVTYLAALYREQLASPHKFMEYLASGKVIVSTYTDEYKDKRSLLEMVDDRSDYLDAFGRVIRRLEEYNSAARQAERKAFAEAHTYSRQLDKIFGLLRQHNLPIV